MNRSAALGRRRLFEGLGLLVGCERCQVLKAWLVALNGRLIALDVRLRLRLEGCLGSLVEPCPLLVDQPIHRIGSHACMSGDQVFSPLLAK